MQTPTRLAMSYRQSEPDRVRSTVNRSTGFFATAQLVSTDQNLPNCVVELIGTPGSGKTTLALAVAAECAQRGFPARLSISARPGEISSASAGLMPRRLTRGPARGSRAAKLGSALLGLLGAGWKEPISYSLLRLMPLPGKLAGLRRRRYISSLAAEPSNGLSLQDQGYVCAIAGLALDSGSIEKRTLAEALDLVPLPQILVRVDVAPEITEARLRQRLLQQTPGGRFFERSAEDNPSLVKVFDLIENLLARRRCTVLHVSGQDQSGLEEAVSAIIAAVLSYRIAASEKAACR
ncbi:hypothetical protein [Pseudoruegeria sp. SK021]|uniref:hypothetical protein n=1 Tax=Pseudoruegeria sp. SK021 TaxID=1933035 RepID=UPI000A23FB8B|nr:hypothetical protein [Pseudoruegeria sp. SK021]OSP53627.1 hypothetical protein BV911_16955 [Pseudoruegeria sp. SK021]